MKRERTREREKERKIEREREEDRETESEREREREEERETERERVIGATPAAWGEGEGRAGSALSGTAGRRGPRSARRARPSQGTRARGHAGTPPHVYNPHSCQPRTFVTFKTMANVPLCKEGLVRGNGGGRMPIGKGRTKLRYEMPARAAANLSQRYDAAAMVNLLLLLIPHQPARRTATHRVPGTG